MSKGWRSQTLKDNLQLADKYLVKPAKEAKYPKPWCLNCLTTCKSNHLYPVLTSRCSGREQPAGQQKAQEIAVALLSYMESSRQKYGWRSVPLVVQCWRGWSDRVSQPAQPRTTPRHEWNTPGERATRDAAQSSLLYVPKDHKNTGWEQGREAGLPFGFQNALFHQRVRDRKTQETRVHWLINWGVQGVGIKL